MKEWTGDDDKDEPFNYEWHASKGWLAKLDVLRIFEAHYKADSSASLRIQGRIGHRSQLLEYALYQTFGSGIDYGLISV